MKSSVGKADQGTEGTDQYKSYLQKRKPPRIVKALSGTGRHRKDDKGMSNHIEESNHSRGKSPMASKVRSQAHAKSILKSTAKKNKRK
jgi:hypothetical protein